MPQRTDAKKPAEQVIDFEEVRAKKLEEKRRKTERLFFKQLLGVYCVTGAEGGVRQMEIVDVSEEGLSFVTPFDSKDPWPTDSKEIPIRMYFSQDTYLPLHIKVANSRPYIEEGIRYVRYGCVVDQSLTTYEAYKQFVKFLHMYSENAHKDKGGVTHFYL
ncbi:MAG: PilZ domain-containing protein [Bacteriovoracia bacterium]